MRSSPVPATTLFALMVITLTQSVAAVAQGTGLWQEQIVRTLSITPSATELEGRDAFGSDGQQVGKVVKANTLADGNVKDIEIQSSGFFGFFSKTYVVSVDKAVVKGGRVDLSIPSDQVKQYAR